MPPSSATPPGTIQLLTPWTQDVERDCPLPEYPRPQLQRPRWQNLNGVWDFAITERAAPPPETFPHEILVPFPIESHLSGVAAPLAPEAQASYRRTFEAPDLAANERLLLHFGGVDWETRVFVNGTDVGVHQGGFDPFHFDITDALVPGQPQELCVRVWDPTDRGPQPIGKQCLYPGLIRYTAVSGIWQTVWLEPVSPSRINGVDGKASLQRRTVTVDLHLHGVRAGDHVEVRLLAGDQLIASEQAPAADAHSVCTLSVPDLHPWSPEDPFLYDVDVQLHRDGETLDQVRSYLGAREISVGHDADGHLRLLLNGAPRFHLGLLDQGWWPDGLYTAPTDEALAFDIEATRRMGFDTIRKHVKVEPARWYWHADRLGVLVWQDMPCPAFDLKPMIEQMGEGLSPEEMKFPLHVTPETEAAYRRELDAMITALSPFPSVVIWVAFNEAWGQFDTDAILEGLAERDPTRLINGPSGWEDTGTGAIRDYHVYQREAEFPPADPRRPTVYGEFGGLKLEVPGHTTGQRGWGYETSETPGGFERRYEELIELVGELKRRGLAGAIYTQTTDVETEWNGLLSYDRSVFKIAPDRLAKLHRSLTDPASRGR